jgi:hypothetical protein
MYDAEQASCTLFPLRLLVYFPKIDPLCYHDLVCYAHKQAVGVCKSQNHPRPKGPTVLKEGE